MPQQVNLPFVSALFTTTGKSTLCVGHKAVLPSSGKFTECVSHIVPFTKTSNFQLYLSHIGLKMKDANQLAKHVVFQDKVAITECDNSNLK